MNLKVKKFVIGPLQVNCYVVHDGTSAIIIDPADDFNMVNTFIQDSKLKVVALLITHAHFDHIREVNKFYEAYQVKVYIHPNEVSFVNDPNKNLSIFFSERIKHSIPLESIQSNTLNIGDFKIDVIHAPGHSPGSVLYYFKEQGILFTGDVLFKGAVGRTDFPTSSSNDLRKSLQFFKTLPKQTIVYPGHEDKTTIKNELESNIYLK